MDKFAALAKNGLGDFSAAGAVAVYYGLQQVIPTMPDLPIWMVGVLMGLATARGIVMLLLRDQDGDGEADMKLTKTELVAALMDASEDVDEARALIEQHATETAPTPVEGLPPVENGSAGS